MLGLEVLNWHVSAQDSKSYSSIVKKYLFGDDISHCAIKITILSTAANDQLIQQYCSPIPHFKTTIFVPEKIEAACSYRPKEVPAWIIYFSRWPYKLATEYEDRISANYNTKYDVDEKWSAFFEKEKITPSRGMLGYWLGKKIYDFCFGKPEKVAAPLMTFVHPHHQREEWIARIEKAKTTHQNIRQQTIEILQTTCKKTAELYLLLLKMERMKSSLESSHYLMSETGQKNLQDRIFFITEKAENLMQELEDLNGLLSETEAAQEEAHRELIALENIFYSQVATIGCKPNHSSRLPIGGQHCSQHGLSLEPMLQKMHMIASDKESFNMVTNNCSNAVFDVLFAGMTAQCRQALIAGKFLQTADFVYPLIACPDEVHRFAQKLEAAWSTFGLSRFLTIAQDADEQVEPNTVYLTNVISTEKLGERLRVEQPASYQPKRNCPTS